MVKLIFAEAILKTIKYPTFAKNNWGIAVFFIFQL
jgi:hypothetical protein